MANDLDRAVNLVPYNEAEQSCMGCEFGRAVNEAYTEIKSVCISH